MRITAEREERAWAPRMTTARHRERKNAIITATEVIRGVREPKNNRERLDLEWASPRKRAEQYALTGDYRIPRREGLRRAASLARQSYGFRVPRTSVKTTFTGKKIAVRSYIPQPGARLTTEGRLIIARHGW